MLNEQDTTLFASSILTVSIHPNTVNSKKKRMVDFMRISIHYRIFKQIRRTIFDSATALSVVKLYFIFDFGKDSATKY